CCILLGVAREMNRFTLSFSDAKLERAFREAWNAKMRGPLRIGLWAVIGLHVQGVFTDSLWVAGHDDYVGMLRMRLASGAPIALALAATHVPVLAANRLRDVILAGASAGVLGASLLLSNVSKNGLHGLT